MDEQDRTRHGGDKPAKRKESESIKQTPSEGQSEATANTSATPARDRKRRTKTGCLSTMPFPKNTRIFFTDTPLSLQKTTHQVRRGEAAMQ